MDKKNKGSALLAGRRQAVSEAADRITSAQAAGYDRYTDKRKILYIPADRLERARPEWNRFAPLKESDPSRYAELLISIDSNGILQPLIVWEQASGRYMVLAGHNRLQAWGDLGKTGGLPCVVYGRDELDDLKAQEIIIDTNYVQRSDNTKETVWIIKNRIDLLAQQGVGRGEAVRRISEILGVKKTRIYDDLKIAEGLTDGLKDIFFAADGGIKKRNILKAASLPPELQSYMYENYKDSICDGTLALIDSSVKETEDIDRIFHTATVERAVKRFSVDARIADDKAWEELKVFFENADGDDLEALMSFIVQRRKI